MKEPRMNLSDHRQFEKHKADLRYIIKNLWRYLKPYIPVLTIIFIGSLASTVLALLAPQICGLAIDEIKTDGSTDMGVIARYGVILAVIYITSGVISYLTSVGMNYVARKMIKRMRQDLFAKLISLPVSYFDTRQAGDIISVLSYDLDTLGASLANDVIMVLTSVVTIIGSLIMMLVNAAMLILVFVVTVPLTFLFTWWLTKKVQPLFRKRSAKLGQLNGFIEEIITGQKTTKAYNAEQSVIDKFEEKNKEAVDAYTIAESYGTISGPSVTFINNLSLALVSVFGAIMYINGSIANLGRIASFVLYSRKFTGPVNEIANVISEFQSAIAASERVFRVMDEQPEPADGEDCIRLENVKGDVEIEHLRFGYNPDKVIIKDFCLNAKAGNIIAIVGHTGAGKTTVINLLMRFYDADSGTIKIDGHDITKVTRQSLRRAFTMVLQDTWLFAGTIYENIAYGSENVTMDDVVRVCKAAKIHSFISRLPDGYNTLLSDNAVNISKGQKQLLTIARAMLLDSPMLILDEATSNVDTRTEQQVQQAMQTLMQGRTSFVIAHRLSTIKNADLILVMDHGDIVEQGTHGELISLEGGTYSRLYYSQFEAAE
ncbi:MAG: ABC transporter ATP-binding protein/permease [Clostridia bacterium]|nr:ABC transporter ATP-binding protein/permease [Clostridia bacterium]